MVKRVKKKRKLALDGVVCVAFRSCWCVGMLGRTIVVFRKWKISKKIRRSHNVERLSSSAFSRVRNSVASVVLLGPASFELEFVDLVGNVLGGDRDGQ